MPLPMTSLNMPSSAFAHLVFVDFENVPNLDLSLIAPHPVRVTLLLGKNQKRLDLSLVQQIHRLGERVELIEVGASGHNALDLTLAYHLGQAVGRSPATEFHIVSKDTDFDPLIAHLRANAVTIARHAEFADLPFLGSKKRPPAVRPKPTESRRAKAVARLKNPASRNRPSSQPALLAHLKTALGKEATPGAAEDIVHELIEAGSLTIDSATGKVSYR